MRSVILIVVALSVSVVGYALPSYAVDVVIENQSAYAARVEITVANCPQVGTPWQPVSYEIQPHQTRTEYPPVRNLCEGWGTGHFRAFVTRDNQEYVGHVVLGVNHVTPKVQFQVKEQGLTATVTYSFGDASGSSHWMRP